VASLLVPYHLDEYLPELGALLPDADAVVAGSLPGETPWARYAALHTRVAEALERLAGDGLPPDVVTADCLVATGTVLGLQRAGHDVGVVWFDGHGDVHTVDSSASGYPGGLSLRIVAGHRPPGWDMPADLRPVPEERLVLVGARDLDPPETEYLAGSRIRQATVPGLGAGDLPDGPLLLHVDVDVVDAAAVPGLRYPVIGGPTPDEVVAAARRVLATGRVVALEVAATWFPVADPPGGRRLLADLLAAAAEARRSLSRPWRP
jgi:arginase